MFKSCETNQSVSNASAKYRVLPPIWNRDIIILSSSSSCCRYFACNTYRLAMVRTQSMQSPLLVVRRSSTVSNRWTNARRAARVGRRRWNAERSEPVSAARLTILCVHHRVTRQAGVRRCRLWIDACVGGIYETDFRSRLHVKIILLMISYYDGFAAEIGPEISGNWK